MGGKLLTAGRTIGGNRQVLLMNPDNGAVVWRQPSERFSGVAADSASGRVWHATGDGRDQKAVVLYSLSIETGEPKELARFIRTLPVTSASVSFVRGQVYVLTVSPDLASKTQLIVVDRFTADGERLSSESNRVPEGTFLRDAIVPRPAISTIDGHPLLWPASSLLVDGDAVYAFTPDGAVYKQLHPR